MVPVSPENSSSEFCLSFHSASELCGPGSPRCAPTPFPAPRQRHLGHRIAGLRIDRRRGAARIVAVEAAAGVEVVFGLAPWPEDQRQFGRKQMGRCRPIGGVGAAVDVESAWSSRGPPMARSPASARPRYWPVDAEQRLAHLVVRVGAGDLARHGVKRPKWMRSPAWARPKSGCAAPPITLDWPGVAVTPSIERVSCCKN